jgi:hypothetical protein
VGGIVIGRSSQQKPSQLVSIFGREAEHPRKYPRLMFTSGVLRIQAVSEELVIINNCAIAAG